MTVTSKGYYIWKIKISFANVGKNVHFKKTYLVVYQAKFKQTSLKSSLGVIHVEDSDYDTVLWSPMLPKGGYNGALIVCLVNLALNLTDTLI